MNTKSSGGSVRLYVLLILCFAASSLFAQSTSTKSIWISPAEISALPTSGTAWNNVKSEADQPTGTPNVSNQDDPNNVRVLAKALVYAKLRDEKYRTDVINACMAAIGTEKGGRTLALSRELIAYVIAADLVGLPADKDQTFRAWLRTTLTETLDGQTLQSTHENRPNNWGTHAGASRAAVAVYLGDQAELERTATVFKGWLGDRSAYAGFEYGDLSWQADPSKPVGINPVGATKNGHSIDGVLPDDQRRAGGFTWPPPKENYAWGALQGALAQAEILGRAGYDVWNWSDKALLRAVKWLHEQADYPAASDDTWEPHLENFRYGSSFPAPIPSSPGKNVGWTDWTHSKNNGGGGTTTQYRLSLSTTGSGSVALNPSGNTYDQGTAVTLTATPAAGWTFSQWQGDLSGSANPATITMNANKSATAVFVQTPATQYTLTTSVTGSGQVSLNPAGGTYGSGTVVTLTATPAAGWTFSQWQGALIGSANPATITMNSNKSVTAVFVQVPANQYTLSVSVVGSGQVSLNPVGGSYASGTVVTLTATPGSGMIFSSWSDDLTGSANPTTITMNANKSVVGTFVASAPPTGGVTYISTDKGGASYSKRVSTSAKVGAVKGNLYLASISTKPYVPVSSVSGMGLVWRLVDAQASGRSQTSVEVWIGKGTPTGDGVVSAYLGKAPLEAVITVCQYSGVDLGAPLGKVVSSNTNGINGRSTNGKDSDSYSFNISTTYQGAVVHAAAATRQRNHIPGAEYKECGLVHHGTSGDAAGLALQDRGTTSNATTVSGSFDGSTDWAVIAVELVPQNALAKGISAPKEMHMLDRNYPNPFNPSTIIRYNLPQVAHATLTIYDILGRTVAVLADAFQEAGTHVYQWEAVDEAGNRLPSGIYLYQLQVGSHMELGKMTLTK